MADGSASMGRPEWLAHLDRSIARQLEHRQTLWRAALALGITGASIATFVARAVDARAESESQLPNLLFGVMFSCALYVLALRPVVAHFAMLPSPARIAPATEHIPRPIFYCLLNPTAWALFLSALAMTLVPPGEGVWMPKMLEAPSEWARKANPWLLGALGFLMIGLESAKLPDRWRNPSRASDAVFIALFAAGALVLPIVALAEALEHAEGGIALLGSAFIPCSFLAALQILRSVIWDRSTDELEALRFQAAREGWTPERIEREYLTLEKTRMAGPTHDGP